MKWAWWDKMVQRSGTIARPPEASSGLSHLLGHIVSPDERPGVGHQTLYDLFRRLDRADGCHTGACGEAHLLMIASRLRGRQHGTVDWHFVGSPEDDRLADRVLRRHISLP